MGIQINGNNDTISALDGSWTAEGATTFTGAAGFNGKVSIGGTLTYEDVTNIDSVGIITARNNIHLEDYIYHKGDPDTYIGFSGANTITAKTTGVERLLIDSTGILKLYGDNGNNSVIYGHRAGSLTYILGNQSGSNDFNIKTWASSTNIIFSIAGNNEKVRIASNGRVGINSTVPTAPLNVQAETSTGTCVRLNQEPTDKRAYIQFQDYATTGTDSYILNEGYDLTVYAGYDGKLNLGAYDTTGITVRSTGKVGVGTNNPLTKFVVSNDGAEGLEVHHASGTVEVNAYKRSDSSRSPFEITAQTFKLSTGNPSLTAGLHQDTSGHVIIGNATYGAAGSFSVASHGSFRQVLASGANQDTLIGAISGVSNGFQINTDGSNNQTYTVHNGSNVSFRITSAGKVGIGYTDPYYPLDVRFNVNTTALSGGSGGNWGGAGLRLENDSTQAGSMSLIHFRTNDADWHVGNKYVSANNSDLVFLHEGTNERLRITSAGNVAIGHTSALHNYAGDVTGTNTRLAAVHQTGTGWKEMAHFAAGTDSDNTGSVVRLSQYGNDRGAYLKAGRGDSDRAIAYFGLRNSGNTDTDLLTFRQDSGEYRTITNSEFRFNTPTNAERAIVAFTDHTTSYNLGSSGGAAIRFKNTSGSHTIEFDTHWSGNHHATALKIGKTGSLIMRDSRDASIGREYTSGTLTNGQSVSYNGSGTTLTNGKLNLNSVGGNGGGWIGCLSVAATDGNPSGAAMIMGVHGQGFNVYNKLLDNFDSGITVTWASGNWSFQIANSSGDTIHYVFNVIHMGTANTTYYGR